MSVFFSDKRPRRVADDDATAAAREAQIIEAVNSLIPNLQTRLPDVFQRVADLIRDTKAPQQTSWGDCRLVKNFYGWAATAQKNSKPSLEILIAILAIHDVLSFKRNDRFVSEVLNRGLDVWVLESIEKLEEEKRLEESSRVTAKIDTPHTQRGRGRPHVKPEQYQLRPSRRAQPACFTFQAKPQDIALPSIEIDDHRGSMPTPAQQRDREGDPSPRTPRTPSMEEQSLELDETPCRSPKRKRRDRSQSSKAPRFVDTGTETDEAKFQLYLQERYQGVANPLANTLAAAFNAHTAQLTQVIPNTVRGVVQTTVAEEIQRQRQEQALRNQQQQQQRAASRMATPLPAAPAPVQMMPARGFWYAPMVAPQPQQPVQQTQGVYAPATFAYEQPVDMESRLPRVRVPEPEGERVVDFSAFRYQPKEERRHR